MAEHLTDIVIKALAPGYALERNHDHWWIKGPDGNWVRDPQNGQYITIRGQANRYTAKQNTLAALRRAGAITEPPKRIPVPRAAAIPTEKKVTNPILMAGDILRDPKAWPRERRIAHEYLQLLKSHEEVKDLARKLGQRLKELQREE